MRKFISIIGYAIGIVILAIIHIGVIYLLPEPYVKLNIIFVFIVLILLIREKGTVVWISFFLHLFLELYATTPFGIILFSGTLSTLLTYWFYQSVFTNKSWFAAMAISIVAISSYRIFYITLLVLTQFVFNITKVVFTPLLLTSLWELLFTTLLVGLIYLVLSKKLRKFDTKVIYS